MTATSRRNSPCNAADPQLARPYLQLLGALKWHGREQFGRLHIALSCKMREGGAGDEVGNLAWIHVKPGCPLRLLRIRGDMRPVFEVDADADDVKAHVNNVLGGCAVVARAEEILEGFAEFAAAVVVVAEVVVAQPAQACGWQWGSWQ